MELHVRLREIFCSQIETFIGVIEESKYGIFLQSRENENPYITTQSSYVREGINTLQMEIFERPVYNRSVLFVQNFCIVVSAGFIGLLLFSFYLKTQVKQLCTLLLH